LDPKLSNNKLASDEKRRQILSAALEVFFKYGYKRVSMNEIAEAAGTVEAAKKRYLRQKWRIF
jgi:TetR/AcrR family transcriptional regulator of autoinduction and epiphytic fitness